MTNPQSGGRTSALTLPIPLVLLVRTKLLLTTLAARYALEIPVLTKTKYALEPGGKASSFCRMFLSSVCLDCAVEQRKSALCKINSDQEDTRLVVLITCTFGRTRSKKSSMETETFSAAQKCN